MIGTLLVIIIIAGFALHQYIKGGIVRGFVFLVAALVGATAAFGYYELLAGYIKDYSFIGPKAYLLTFFLLFILAFILVREVANTLLKPDISFGLMVDRAGGVVLGVLIGYLFSGVILITIGLIPYKTNWLYARFEDNINNPPQPNRMLFNPEGFLSGFFGMLSNGSLKGESSFALVHADYADQIFLNRRLVSEGVSPIAGNEAVKIAAPGVRPAPENLTAAAKQQGLASEPVTPEAGKTIMLVRLQISAHDLVVAESGDQAKFALAQLRLVVKDKQSAADLSSGSGEAVYPIGYLNSAGQLLPKPLNAVLSDEELKAGSLDFAFNVPANSTPVLLEFRQNIIEKVGQSSVAGQQPETTQPPAEPNAPGAPTADNNAPANQPAN